MPETAPQRFKLPKFQGYLSSYGSKNCILMPLIPKRADRSLRGRRNFKRRRNRSKEKSKCSRGAKLIYDVNIFLKSSVLGPVFSWPTGTDGEVPRNGERLLVTTGSFVPAAVEAVTPQTSVMPHKSKLFLLPERARLTGHCFSVHHRRVKNSWL